MRSKIVLPNFFAVLLIGIVAYFLVHHNLTDRLVTNLDQQLATTQSLFDRAERYRASELKARVSEYAATRDAARAFAPLQLQREKSESQEEYESRLRTAWAKQAYRSVETFSEIWRQSAGRRPGFIFVTDRNGTVVARNTTPGACPTGYNATEAMPAVAKALSGSVAYQVWSVDDSPFSSTKPKKDHCQLMNTGLLEVAAAPVYPEGDIGLDEKIAGVIVVGFELSNGTAVHKSNAMGFDYAVLKGSEFNSSSFETDAEREALSLAISESGSLEAILAATSQGKPSDLFQIKASDQFYHAIAAPVPYAIDRDSIAYVILAPIAEVTDTLKILNVLLLALALSLIGTIIIGVVLGNYFLSPIMIIEEGVLRVLNGEYKHRFEVESAEFGGLSYRINQLIGVLTGEDENNENGNNL